MDKKFDYRKGTVVVRCLCCDREITEYEVNKQNPSLFKKEKIK